MFEQQSYIPEAEAPVPDDGVLFRNYEIKPWEMSPRLYKILAASAIFNILAFVVIAQSNLLTMKGCDSPFVGRVCQVLDTVYIGAVLFGTERDYIDVEYDRIDLGSAEITMIDVSNEGPQLQYPEGYFQLANPEQYSAMMGQDPLSGFDSGFSTLPPPGPDLMNTRPVLPPPTRNPIARGNLPDSPLGDIEEDGEEESVIAGNRKGGGGRLPGAENSNQETEVADAGTNTNTAPQATQGSGSGVDINRRPIVDLANHVNELRDESGLNLQGNFIIKARGRLDKEGKLDPKTFRYMEAQGEEQLVGVVQEGISSINAAGFLKYLHMLSGEDLNLIFQQDAENLSALIESQMASETRAKSVKSLLELFLNDTRNKKMRPDATQDDKDDLTLLQGAVVRQEGAKLIIEFVVPKNVAHPMIERKLAEQKAEARKPNGNAGLNTNNNSASR
ncbi:MAG TPA: hypothetical protein VK918_07540 [Pyrinomonadaceae bacterium]|nr:hypothetical protein [Pyrinomonadaceae bacterium]